MTLRLQDATTPSSSALPQVGIELSTSLVPVSLVQLSVIDSFGFVVAITDVTLGDDVPHEFETPFVSAGGQGSVGDATVSGE